jgi:acetoacetyl-CoA synthetase
MAETDPAQPANAQTVERLCALWSRVLGVSPVLPDSDFFDLGGDSLLAVDMLLAVERELGVGLPVTIIYDAPTVAALAALLDKESRPAFSPLVCLNDGEGAPPLFVVHGLGGTVIELSKVAKLIRHGGPVYGVQAKGLDGILSPLTTVEDMAAYYVDAIREVQPEGPYYLAGYSFGGLVALEMARRLKEQHDDVELLLIDAFALPRTWPIHCRIAVLARRLVMGLARILRQPWQTNLAYLVRMRGDMSQRPPESRAEATRRSVRRWLRHMMVDLPPALRQVLEASEEALYAYRPRFYPGTVTFLNSATTLPVFPPNAARIWRPLVRELNMVQLPGDHFSILTEHAQSTAAVISTRLAEARRIGEAVARSRLPDAPAFARKQSVGVIPAKA